MARDRESEDKMSDTENKPQNEIETPEDETVDAATEAATEGEVETELDPVLKAFTAVEFLFHDSVETFNVRIKRWTCRRDSSM